MTFAARAEMERGGYGHGGGWLLSGGWYAGWMGEWRRGCLSVWYDVHVCVYYGTDRRCMMSLLAVDGQQSGGIPLCWWTTERLTDPLDWTRWGRNVVGASLHCGATKVSSFESFALAAHSPFRRCRHGAGRHGAGRHGACKAECIDMYFLQATERCV